MNSLPFQDNISLSDYTTIHLGGLAKKFVTISSVDELLAALTFAKESNLPVHILGGGSNTIFPDDGFKGLVIHIQIKGITEEQQGNVMKVRVGAGEEWDPFVAYAINRGLAGIECLSGIPGYVGATPMQNVGAYGQEVAETISSVEAIDHTTLQPISFTNEECDFAYRMSRFKGKDANRYVITYVEYTLTPHGEPHPKYDELTKALKASSEFTEAATSKDRLVATRNTVLSLRKKKSMVVDPNDPNSRSCGSFFMNPMLSKQEFEALQQRTPASPIPSFDMGNEVKVPAAYLIEHAGFTKGFRHKGAGISTNHTLALVNVDGSTSDVLELAQNIEEAVFETFGLRLYREPVVVTN